MIRQPTCNRAAKRVQGMSSIIRAKSQWFAADFTALARAFSSSPLDSVLYCRSDCSQHNDGAGRAARAVQQHSAARRSATASLAARQRAGTACSRSTTASTIRTDDRVALLGRFLCRSRSTTQHSAHCTHRHTHTGAGPAGGPPADSSTAIADGGPPRGPRGRRRPARPAGGLQIDP